MPDNLIAVTGATGEVGSRVAARLAAGGARRRLIVRDAERAQRIDGEVAVASGYIAGDEMRAALDGADTVFLIPARESANRLAEHVSAVDAAVAAGVKRIVYLSFVGAARDAVFTLARHHFATEERIRATGVPFTFLRMSMYMDFIPSMVSPAGVISGPAGDGRVAAVLRDDIADAAVAVLMSDDHEGLTYQLTGKEAFTAAEAAALMTRISGKQISFHNETVDEAYASRAVYGAPDWEVEGWVTSYTAIAEGQLATVTDDVRRLAGHDPVTLDEYVRSHPESLAHVSAA